jgi:hypothetical protein
MENNISKSSCHEDNKNISCHEEKNKNRVANGCQGKKSCHGEIKTHCPAAAHGHSSTVAWDVGSK